MISAGAPVVVDGFGSSSRSGKLGAFPGSSVTKPGLQVALGTRHAVRLFGMPPTLQSENCSTGQLHSIGQQNPGTLPILPIRPTQGITKYKVLRS